MADWQIRLAIADLDCRFDWRLPIGNSIGDCRFGLPIGLATADSIGDWRITEVSTEH
jgi:hypothetical protein